MGAQCSRQGSDLGLMPLPAGCSLKGFFNFPSVNACGLAWSSRSTRNGSTLEMPSPEMRLYFIPRVLAV